MLFYPGNRCFFGVFPSSWRPETRKTYAAARRTDFVVYLVGSSGHFCTSLGTQVAPVALRERELSLVTNARQKPAFGGDAKRTPRGRPCARWEGVGGPGPARRGPRRPLRCGLGLDSAAWIPGARVFRPLPAQSACPEPLRNAGRGRPLRAARPHSVIIYNDAMRTRRPLGRVWGVRKAIFPTTLSDCDSNHAR